MRRLKNILLFLLLGAMALHAQDKPAAPQQPAKPPAKLAAVAWHEKTAVACIRFTVFSKRSPVIFVPVPTELADSAKNVAAIDDRGTRLEAFPFFQDGKLIGAAVNAAKLTAPGGQPPNIRPNASLYLLPEAPKGCLVGPVRPRLSPWTDVDDARLHGSGNATPLRQSQATQKFPSTFRCSYLRCHSRQQSQMGVAA